MPSFNGSALAVGDSLLLSSFGIELREQKAGKKYLEIGDNSVIGGQFIFETEEGEIQVGNRVFMESATLICRSRIVIEDDVIIESGTCLYDHTSHSLDYRERQKDIRSVVEDHRFGRRFVQSKDWSVVGTKPIQICQRSLIGRSATVLKGVTIGAGAVVAPFSVVIKNVEPWTMVAGNPAEVVRVLAQDNIE